MAGGPFTERDQWHHPGLADRTSCSMTLRCIKGYKDLILAILGAPASVGASGDGVVYKNGNSYLLFDDGLYRRNVGAMVEGQPQGGYEVTGYTYANIP